MQVHLDSHLLRLVRVWYQRRQESGSHSYWVLRVEAAGGCDSGTRCAFSVTNTAKLPDQRSA